MGRPRTYQFSNPKSEKSDLRLQESEPLNVALAFAAAEDGGAGHAENLNTEFWHVGDHAVEHGLGFFFGEDTGRGIASFVVGFDEGDDAGCGGCGGGGGGFEPLEGGGDQEGLFGPAQVGDDEVDLLGRGEVERVGAFDEDDARVVAEFPGKLAVGGVDGVDLGGAVLEQAVGEAAGGGAEVGACEDQRG